MRTTSPLELDRPEGFQEQLDKTWGTKKISVRFARRLFMSQRLNLWHRLYLQHKLYVIFCVTTFRKVGKFVASIKRQKSQKCFSFRGFCPLPFWPGALPLDSAGACAPRPPFI